MTVTENRLSQAVSEILFREWDPIGVNNFPEARDDSYVSTICRMLESGVDEVKLTDHLRRLRTNSMGLAKDDEHDRRIARRLRGLVEVG